jgi:peroxiredoxin
MAGRPVLRPGPWLVAAAVAAAAAYALLGEVSTPPPLGRGSPAPAFALRDLEGTTVSLDELRGRVVLVNFWATWCKPCEDEMPAMQQLYAALRGDGFELLAVSVDADRSLVEDFRDRLALSFPILLDPEQEASKAYQTYRFPESFLVDGKGTIVERYVGPREWASPAYVERVRRLLATGG